jgi:hypothetical protein
MENVILGKDFNLAQLAHFFMFSPNGWDINSIIAPLLVIG